LDLRQGYAFVEYETREEAEEAVAASGSELLEQPLTIDFAFVRPPVAYASASTPLHPPRAAYLTNPC